MSWHRERLLIGKVLAGGVQNYTAVSQSLKESEYGAEYRRPIGTLRCDEMLERPWHFSRCSPIVRWCWEQLITVTITTCTARRRRCLA